MVATCPSRSYNTVSPTRATLNNAGARRSELRPAAGTRVGRDRDVRPRLAAREGLAVRTGHGQLAGEPRPAPRFLSGAGADLDGGVRRPPPRRRRGHTDRLRSGGLADAG